MRPGNFLLPAGVLLILSDHEIEILTNINCVSSETNMDHLWKTKVLIFISLVQLVFIDFASIISFFSKSML